MDYSTELTALNFFVLNNGIKYVVTILAEATPLVIFRAFNIIMFSFRAIGSNNFATTDFNPWKYNCESVLSAVGTIHFIETLYVPSPRLLNVAILFSTD